MATPRSQIVDPAVTPWYHCVSRCVRRAFLCGEGFEHRKQWIEDRLQELAGIFAVDCAGFAVLDNHVHVLLRLDVPRAEAWSAEEVARRCLVLFTLRGVDGHALAVSDARVQQLAGDADVVAELRHRLSDLSWIIKCLKEPLARLANKQDYCTGAFWQGRFSSVRLLDESALLACSMYVDLNPIRAGIADSPEESEHTSAYERIIAREQNAQATSGVSVDGTGAASDRDGWMAPVPLSGDPEPKSARNSSRRASNRGFLEMTLDEYLAALDWTGRELRAGKKGVIPTDLPPILGRLDVDARGWLECVSSFGRWFRAAAGRVGAMTAHAHRTGRSWIRGIAMSRLAFG